MIEGYFQSHPHQSSDGTNDGDSDGSAHVGYESEDRRGDGVVHRMLLHSGSKCEPSLVRSLVFGALLSVAHIVLVTTAVLYISLTALNRSPRICIALKPMPIYCIMFIVACQFVQFVLNYRYVIKERGISEFAYIVVAFSFQMLGLFSGSIGDIMLNVPSIIPPHRTDAAKLEIVFFGLGVLGFLTGHLLYIAAYSVTNRQKTARGKFSCFCNLHLDIVHGWVWMLVVFLLASAMFLMMMLREKSAVLGGLVCYLVIISLFLWKMCQKTRKRIVLRYGDTYHNQNSTYQELIYQHVRAVSAILFVISDSTIAINKFVTPVPRTFSVIFIMITYYVAQYGIGLSFNEYLQSADTVLENEE